MSILTVLILPVHAQNASWRLQFISVQLFSFVWLFVTPWSTAHQASLSITNSWSLLKLISFESVMASNHLILCHPLLLLPSIFPSTRVFSNESALHIRWPKCWSFSFSISPSNELISFRIDWWDLLAVQGTLKSLLQHHKSKASFFDTQLSLKKRKSWQSHPTAYNFKSYVSSLIPQKTEPNVSIHSPTLTSIHDYWKNHSFN